MVEHVNGSAFNKEFYRANPSLFRSVFHETVLPYTSALINCMYWDSRFPRLVTNEQAMALEQAGRLRLLGVADITCDMGGSVEFSDESTHIETPFLVRNLQTGVNSRNMDDPGVMVMEQLLAVNFLAPARLTRAAWPSLTERRGCVINVSSVAVIDPFFGNGFYGATKSALDGLTRAIHKEGSTAGVRSFSLAAGSVETDMLRSIADESVLPKTKTISCEEVASRIFELWAGSTVRPVESGSVMFLPTKGVFTASADEALLALASLWE